MYHDSDGRASSGEESVHLRLSYVYQIDDVINNSSFAVVCSTSSQEFEDLIVIVNVEDILIEMKMYAAHT